MNVVVHEGFNNLTVPETYVESEPIVNNQLRELLDVVTHFVILFFASLGVATNTINMRVFISQGFSDSNTIGLFFLAFADFFGCLVEIPAPFCTIMPYFGLRQTYYSCVAWTSVIGHTTHMLMSRITCLITVYIAVERCLCVLIPFKVKTIFQPKTTATSMALIYVMVVGAYLPFYLNTWLTTIFHGGLNTTITILYQSPQGQVIAYYNSFIFNNILSTAAIIVVAIATGLMIYKLVESRKFRQNASAAKDDSQQKPATARENRELEVLKMVTMVTAMFLICTIMSHIPGMTVALIPGTTPAGINKNLFYVVFTYKVIFDLINSSLNYFFYVRISSKYKIAFNNVFGRTRTQKD